MPNLRRDYIYILIIACIILLFRLDACQRKDITIPAKTGTLHDTIKVTHTEFVPKEKVVTKYVPHQVVKTDTVKLDGKVVYIEPIDTLKTVVFSKPYEDKNVKITAKGIVTGRINDISIDYTIKEQKVPQKKPTRFGIGVQVGYGIDGKPYVGAGISYNLIRF